MRRSSIAVGLLALATAACTSEPATSEPAISEPGTTRAAVSDPAAPGAAGSEPAPDAGTVLRASTLDGDVVPSRFTLRVDLAGATSAELVTDGAFAGEREGDPPEFELELGPGEHRIRVRATVDGDEVRIDADVTVAATDAADATDATVRVVASTLPRPAPPPADGGRTVSTTEALRDALASAVPGDVIVLADGEYRYDDRLVASASGTPDAPITLRGSRAATIRTKNASGDYGLHVTGDFWRIEGLTIAHATKGIVLDGSVGSVIDDVEVFDIGDEGIHFRSCSSDGVLRNSHVHDTGRNSPQYGEGVYVGSASSNWSKYECTDAVEGDAEGDNTERVLIEDNLFEDVTAEGADLKEGTDSGVLRGNTFRRVGASGQNSADSAVDAKGNGWLIEGNVVSEAGAAWDDDGERRPSEFADGFQSHSVYEGYGTRNVFRGNRVEGAIPGFGVGLYPALDNVVACDNEAPGAEQGEVGDNGRATTCSAG